MKTIIGYIKQYAEEVNKRAFIVITVFTGVLVFINYQFGLDELIRKKSWGIKLIGWYLVFAAAFILPWLLTGMLKKVYPVRSEMIILLFLAPLLFALKISLNISLPFSEDAGWNNYWNQIIYWPLLTVIIGFLLLVIWRFFHPREPFYGIKTKGIDWKPYFMMLLIMLPLMTLASSQKDFLSVYPKLQSIENMPGNETLNWWHKLLYVLSYGTDFITIEFFFRGFLVLAFVKWAGKDVILPMTCFYCSIHFGKPLGECISSYFGGIILGIIVYNTRSVWGGLLVHLGVAWLMELGGYIGNNFQ